MINSTTREETGVFLSVDGNNVLSLGEFDRVAIRSAAKKVNMVTFGDEGFYKKLQRKLLGK